MNCAELIDDIKPVARRIVLYFRVTSQMIYCNMII